jgi:thioredoxin-related protein
VAAALDKFVFVSIDTDRDKQNLSKKFRIRAVPTFVFLNSKGEPASILPGAVPAEIFVAVLDYISSGSYQTMEFDEYALQNKINLNS